MKTLRPSDVCLTAGLSLSPHATYVVGVPVGRQVAIKSPHTSHAGALTMRDRLRRAMRSMEPEVYRVEREAGDA